VIAVGAADPNGTPDRRDDVVAQFSTRGDARRHADVLAPGHSVVSLRVPGSFVDTRYPTALVAGDPAQRFFRGSGTSQAAAVVSGAAALLLQQRPSLTPHQVKRLLMNATEAMPTGAGDIFGTGQIDVKRAAATATPPGSTQNHRPALGTGSLELSRGTAHVADPDNGVVLAGERDIFGTAWAPATWTVAAAAGRAWDGGTWNGTKWTGSDWTGDSWADRTWSARTWSGGTWSGGTWSARTWSDAYWTGDAWSGRTWSGRTWSARTWSGDYWSAGQWR
jgi:serine protease AprX